MERYDEEPRGNPEPVRPPGAPGSADAPPTDQRAAQPRPAEGPPPGMPPEGAQPGEPFPAEDLERTAADRSQASSDEAQAAEWKAVDPPAGAPGPSASATAGTTAEPYRDTAATETMQRPDTGTTTEPDRDPAAAETTQRQEAGTTTEPYRDSGAAETTQRPDAGLAADQSGPASELPNAAAAASAQTASLPDQPGVLSHEDARDFQTRWEVVQATFVDDPHAATGQADALVGEVMERLAQLRGEYLGQLRGALGEGNDTEAMRIALQRYRAFFNALLGS